MQDERSTYALPQRLWLRSAIYINPAFVDFIRERYEGDGYDFDEIEKSTDIVIHCGSPGNKVTLNSENNLLNEGRYWELLLVNKVSVPHHPGTGRILNPKWADVGILKQWKEQCLSTHGAARENPSKVWPTRPAYLIDVANKCLVAGCVSEAFVALSYTYGRFSIPTIDAAALERLQEPHALDAPECDGYLSPIIRHAIELTSVIGERYLWADAFCIPHANEELRSHELRMMGSIYASAILTIIAQDGDSQDGLPGLQGISPPREINDQRIIPFGSENLILRYTRAAALSNMSAYPAIGPQYHARAWTFQEYRLSRRRVIFKNQELHWQCQCNTWHEEMILGANINNDSPDLGQRVIMSGFPDLGSLGRIITDFNKTELRYDEDILPAFSGLLSVLSRSFTGGFLYGIPEMFFERGLGWCPYWDHTDIQRRIISGRPVENRRGPGLAGRASLAPSGTARQLESTTESIGLRKLFLSRSGTQASLPETHQRRGGESGPPGLKIAIPTSRV